MQRDFEHGTRAGIFDDGVAAWLRVGRHRARGHPAEERFALVVAVSDDVTGGRLDLPSTPPRT
eukprot:5638945-Prymnesium_polylepis.1